MTGGIGGIRLGAGHGMTNEAFILGEYRRTLDERYRLSIPQELTGEIVVEGTCMLAKERPGCLSLWNRATWKQRMDQGVDLVRAKLQAGRLGERTEQIQVLGRLLSTRHKEIQVTGRGRLLIPEGFREFLGVEAGGEVMLVGAAVCVEVWQPEAWLACLERQMPEFMQLLNELAD